MADLTTTSPSAGPEGTARTAAEVPGPSSGPLSMLRHLRPDPANRLLDLRRRYGSVVKFRLPRVTLYLVSDPTVIQEALTRTGRSFGKGLVRAGADPTGPGEQALSRLLGGGLLTSSGDLHKRQRRLMQPLFHQERIAGYGTVFADQAESTVAGWPEGATIDLHAEMTEMTLGIIARTVFDVTLDTQVAEVIRLAMRELGRGGPGPFNPRMLADKLPLPSTRRRTGAVQQLHRTVEDLIAQRRRDDSSGAGGSLAGASNGSDLLSLLLSTRDADTGEPMSEQQVHDEALTILLAGHETTANALSWAFHLLGQDQERQRRLQAELDRVLAGRTPTVADLPDLMFTAAVFSESMRLYPPAWMMMRRLLADWDVAGYRLPAGSVMLLSPYVVHRDSTWWPDPDAFRPERWLPGPDAGPWAPPADRPRYSYFPFGGGPRQCIGNSFAELEGVLCLATLAQRRRVSPASDQLPATRAAVTLRPRHGLPMLTHRRTPPARS